MPFRNRLATSVALLVILAGAPAPAWAASPKEIADALTQLVKTHGEGGTIAFGSSSEDGGNIVFKDVVLTSPEADDTKIGELTFANASIGDDGAVTADQVNAKTISGGADGSSFTADSIELTNPVFSSGGKNGKVDSVSADNISVGKPGQPPVTIASIGLDLADFADDVPHSIDLSVEGLVIEPAALEEDSEDMAAQLKAVGYDKLELSFYGAGSLNQDNGELSVDEITVDGADMGTLTFSGVFGGLTDDVLKELAKPSPSPQLATKVTLKQAGIYYGDASLAERVIAHQAKQMGQEPDAFVDQITGALPLMLSMIGNPAFQDKLATGLTTFLKEPKNITVSVQPDAPISLMDLFTAAMSTPQQLPDMLKADVAANQQDEEAPMDDADQSGSGN